MCLAHVLTVPNGMEHTVKRWVTALLGTTGQELAVLHYLKNVYLQLHG